MTQRNFNRIFVGIALATCIAPLAGGTGAFAQTMTWGRLTVNSGPPVHDWEIANWIDKYFLDGNPGDGVVSSNIIYIETQCYEEAADNFNAQIDEAVGGWAYDNISFTNTTYLGAQAPGLPSYYRGFHDDAARALRPGSTAFEVLGAGWRGRDMRENCRIAGDLDRSVGGASSTHVLVWAGRPEPLDHRDVEAILANFRSAPFTTIDVLSGDGSNSYGGHADSVGAATRANLESKLDDIGLLMNLGPDEQFHGNRPFATATSTPLTADTFE